MVHMTMTMTKRYRHVMRMSMDATRQTQTYARVWIRHVSTEFIDASHCGEAK